MPLNLIITAILMLAVMLLAWAVVRVTGRYDTRRRENPKGEPHGYCHFECYLMQSGYLGRRCAACGGTVAVMTSAEWVRSFETGLCGRCQRLAAKEVEAMDVGTRE